MKETREYLSIPCQLGGQLSVVGYGVRLTKRDIEDLSELVALWSKAAWPSREDLLAMWECAKCSERYREDKLVACATVGGKKEGCPDCGERCFPVLALYPPASTQPPAPAPGNQES